MVTDNIVWDIEGRSGIRVYTTFVKSGADHVTIENNIVWNPDNPNNSIAIHDGNGGFGLNSLATVSASNNLTDDGSGAAAPTPASVFIGPLGADADSCSGPGSGFTLK